MRVNLGAVLVTGLFAGGISCAAVQGGLLAGLITRQRASSTADAGSTATTRAARLPAGGGTAGIGSQPAGETGRQQGRARTVAEPLPKRVLGGLRAARAQAGDHLAPVAGFLGGKLFSHSLLGALLGALGTAVQLTPTVRVWTQLAAGALIIAFGLAQLGVGPFKRLTVEPPAAWSRFVRGRARSQSAFAPALLGFFTVVIPCGITLSVEALALTAGSALAGAATMSVFVIGTAPLFMMLGYAARQAATAWQGRLAIGAGLMVLGVGLYTFNAALNLADSPLAAKNLSGTLGFRGGPAVGDRSAVHRNTTGRQEVIVTARSDSYEPGNIAVKAGIPTSLVVRSQENEGCTRVFVIPTLNKQWTLPEDGDVRIDLGVLQPGELAYTCAMGMYGGKLTITNQQ
ncbi:sulfite exporter TauE/SafE family protein [Micromonospora sp. NPDC005806]|uniref:sulfite exporter TauE/SafE family protein n=1 Tax=Micromonospora sp. NPDC005806 TaxID=3364234 RepID=UPI0036865DBD